MIGVRINCNFNIDRICILLLMMTTLCSDTTSNMRIIFPAIQNGQELDVVRPVDVAS